MRARARESYRDPDAIPLSVIIEQDGRPLRHHTDAFVVRSIASLMDTFTALPGMRHAETLLDRDSLLVWLERRLHLELAHPLRGLLRRRVARAHGWPYHAPVRCPRLLTGLVRAQWPDPDIQILPEPVWREVRRRFRSVLRDWRDQVWIMSCPRPASPLKAQPRIGVEIFESAGSQIHLEGASCDRRGPSFKCDPFWLASDTIQPGEVLGFVSGKNKTLDFHTQRQILEQWGVQVVALHPSVRPRGRRAVWRPRVRSALPREMACGLPSAHTDAERWLHQALSACAQETAYWEALARDFHLVVFQPTMEWSTDAPAQRLAMHRLGGIEVGKIRSEFIRVYGQTFYLAHSVLFVWHEVAERFLEASRMRAEAVVVTGWPFDHTIPACADMARRLRNRLERIGVRTVAAVYDNVYPPHGQMDGREVAAFYRCILDWAEAHPEVGLVVKSKTPWAIGKLPGIQQRVMALQETGRCIMLDGLSALLTPSVLAADVSLTVPLSTVSCEAALCGRRVIVFDPCGSDGGHPFATEGAGTIVFSDLGAFRDALERYVEDPVQSRIGDASGIVGRLDPYRDGQAAERAAAFLRRFLDAKAQGLERASALRESLKVVERWQSPDTMTAPALARNA